MEVIYTVVQQARLEKVQQAITLLLEAHYGENWQKNQHLIDTPKRVAEMYEELFYGLHIEPPKITCFSSDTHDIVVVKEIPFYSLCAHHLLPFFGYAHVAYIPNGYIIGLSKIARIVEYFARRPQIQEELTSQIADYLLRSEQLKPSGVMVIMEAEHLCMIMRGIQKPGSKTVTSAIRGLFKQQLNPREEVLELLKLKNKGA